MLIEYGAPLGSWVAKENSVRAYFSLKRAELCTAMTSRLSAPLFCSVTLLLSGATKTQQLLVFWAIGTGTGTGTGGEVGVGEGVGLAMLGRTSPPPHAASAAPTAVKTAQRCNVFTELYLLFMMKFPAC